MQKDFYSILEVSQTATTLEIKKAFRKKAVKYHPDKNFGEKDFTKIFIDVKEAYDTLVDPEKRELFDIEYQKFYGDSHTQHTNSREKKYDGQDKEQTDQKFRRDPYKSFYSEHERQQQETPQFKPKKTPWGTELNNDFEFFALPKSIGKILGGFSTIPVGVEKISLSKLIFTVVKSGTTILILLVWAFLVYLLRQYWYFSLHRENATQIMAFSYVVILLFTIALRVLNRYNAVAFQGLNYFIGINGFALYVCKEAKENIVYGRDVNFNEVTDLITCQGKTNQLKEKWYQFIWYNSTKQEVVFERSGKYDDFSDDLVKHEHPLYWMNIEAEKSWTIYLLDNMEANLDKKGYLEFNVFDWDDSTFSSYLQLGIGFITFIQGDEKLTYKYKNIKRMYTRGNELFIEKDNYEKILFIFKTGNKNSIPLDSLCNKLFFIRAAEILLGYSIIE